MASPLSIDPIDAPHANKGFVRLPVRLYRGAEGFVAPLEMTVRETLDRKQNKFFEHADAAYWLARRDGAAVGRISAQIDRLSPEIDGARVGSFGFFDTEDDPETARALLSAAEDWLRAKGVSIVQGPFSHSINEEVGLLVDGFASRNVVMMPWHPPYAGAHVEAAGYTKARDVHAWDYDVGTGVTVYGAKKKAAESGITIRKLNTGDFSGDIERVVSIFNDAWSQNWGFIPFTENEVAHLAEALKPIVHPELVIILELDGEPVAFAICLPNIQEAADGLGGRLLPFGWAQVLWRLKAAGVKSARVPLMGVRKKLQTSLYGAVAVRAMLEELDESMAGQGFATAELSWILEDNRPMIGILRSIGARRYKTYRVYEKRL